MRTTILHGVLLGLRVGWVHADCYAHDGVLARNSAAFREDFEMVSCGNGTNNCCFQGDKCGSNLLCVNSEGTPTRQYCAVSNWEGCSSMCADYATTGTLLVSCGKNMYCCGAVDSSCCDDDDQHYFVDPETGEVKHPSKATGASATASPTWWTVDSKALLAATSTSSALSSSATIASTTESSTSSASATATAPTTTSTPTNTSPPAKEEEKSSSLSAGAGAGIGIGAAAVVALVGGLAWWLLKRKKQHNAYEAPMAQHVEGASYTGGAYRNEAKPTGDYYAHQGPPVSGNSSFAPQELDASVPVQEMQGNSARAMLK